MFSEIHADCNCNAYEQILLAAIETKNEIIMNFCKENIYAKYKDELSEAFREENTIIKKHFSKS